jgi:hypothetical protein
LYRTTAGEEKEGEWNEGKRSKWIEKE